MGPQQPAHPSGMRGVTLANRQFNKHNTRLCLATQMSYSQPLLSREPCSTFLRRQTCCSKPCGMFATALARLLVCSSLFFDHLPMIRHVLCSRHST